MDEWCAGAADIGDWGFTGLIGYSVLWGYHTVIGVCALLELIMGVWAREPRPARASPYVDSRYVKAGIRRASDGSDDAIAAMKTGSVAVVDG